MPPTMSKGPALALAVITAAVIVLGLFPTSASAATSQNCKLVSAGGQTYSVSATNVSCAFARQWVGKLAAKRVSKAHNNTLSGAPSGYKCLAGSNQGNELAKENHIAANVQQTGNCAKGLGLGKQPYFNWGIQYASG